MKPLLSSFHSQTQRGLMRSNQRGAAVFIVMMAILMLTGAGTWAVHSAGLTNQASGNARAAAQAQFMSELGIQAGTAYLSMPGFADAQYSVATDRCRSAVVGQFCKSIFMAEIDASIERETTVFGSPITTLDMVNAEGSLSPFATGTAHSIEGRFEIEMTDPRPVLKAGTDVSSGIYQRITLTSYGTVRPYAAAVCTDAASQNASATTMGMRSHVILGPLGSQSN